MRYEGIAVNESQEPRRERNTCKYLPEKPEDNKKIDYIERTKKFTTSVFFI
jgi:hypothetical protein